MKLDIRCLADKRFKYQRFFTTGGFGKSKPNINAKEYHFNLPLDDLLLAGSLKMGIIGPSCFKVQQQFAKELALWNTGPVFSKIYARKLVRFGRLRRVPDISIHSLLYLASHPVIQRSSIVKVLTVNPDFSGFRGSLPAG
jgi:hypothetical protein